MIRPIVLVLGRNGDILNGLQMAWSIRADRPFFCVGKEWAHLLAGVSYVEPIVYDGNYTDQSKAILWLRKTGHRGPIITAQCYQHPSDRVRRTDSYQKESWRVAQMLEKFGTLPLVIDRRSPAREAELVKIYNNGKPMLLIAAAGISSPFSLGQALLDAAWERFSADYNMIDLSKVHAERVYDLLGLYDAAQLLVSVDSVHLHLARAAKVPVIAITNNDWKGSVPPPATVAAFRYKNATVDGVIAAIASSLAEQKRPRDVIHAVHMHGDTERHQRAQKTWSEVDFHGRMYRDSGCFNRTAISIGDKRDVPAIKDLLSAAMESCQNHDVIVWANSDIGLDPRISRWARHHVGLYGAASMRRNGGQHIGRDLFAFRVDWLANHWAEIPDFFLGSPCFDLILAGIIRKHRGIVTTQENLEIDFYPCDATERYALHEDHPSTWAGPNEFKYAANNWNRRLAKEWAKQEGVALNL